MTFMSLLMAEKIIQTTVFANWDLLCKTGPLLLIRGNLAYVCIKAGLIEFVVVEQAVTTTLT